MSVLLKSNLCPLLSSKMQFCICVGHTHAGQLFPLTILAFLMNPFFCGLYRVSEHTMVYVTSGTGYYGIPMRIASRSEITNIILKRA